MWALSDHVPAKRVFTEFQDGGGWGSMGLSTLVGIGSPLWFFIGPDAGAHMSEELKGALQVFRTPEMVVADLRRTTPQMHLLPSRER